MTKKELIDEWEKLGVEDDANIFVAVANEYNPMLIPVNEVHYAYNENTKSKMISIPINVYLEISFGHTKHHRDDWDRS